jgi:hypothetical protein
MAVFNFSSAARNAASQSVVPPPARMIALR